MRRTAKLVGTLFLSMIIVVAQNPRELIDEARALIDRGDVDEAEQKLLSVIDVNSAYAPAYYLLSKISFSRGDLGQTGKYLREAIENDAGNEEYRAEYARIGVLNMLMADGNRKLSGGDYEAALSKFEEVEEKYPDFAGALYYIGLVYLRQDEITKAAASFRRASEISPSYQKPARAFKNLTDKTFNKGNQSLRRGDYEGATATYELVLKLDPNYYKAHFQLGVISTKLGEYGEAMKRYEQSVSINPTYAKGWFGLGLSQQRNGDYEGALASLRRATEADPTYAKAYAQIGAIRLLQRDYDGAEQAYNMAIQADPSYSKSYVDLGKMYVSEERFGEAVSTLTTAIALDEKSYEARYLLAQSRNALGQCEEAKEAAHSALSIKANYAAAQFELGIAEACLGNKTAALNAFNKARNDRAWRKVSEYQIDKIKNPQKYKDS